MLLCQTPKAFPVGHPILSWGGALSIPELVSTRAGVWPGLHHPRPHGDLSPHCLAGQRIWEGLAELVVSEGEKPALAGKGIYKGSCPPPGGTGLAPWLGLRPLSPFRGAAGTVSDVELLRHPKSSSSH